ncbi:Low-density lipoprotein receptor-related protein 1 [Hypsibius exemplaris]|uniref:Low-density lipoprotein receptor-related protein 1 n=1 Tax=Hypsibius exemplaris TaxID=2072580 RepID=A0A1W0WEM3_HYPEX|nr:Low-density lipoprotein receptor-related protein 1 [Hypsibius exemplaris]
MTSLGGLGWLVLVALTCCTPCLSQLWFTRSYYAPTTTSSGCSPGYFRCNSGTCILDSWYCDGAIECMYGEDEPLGCVPRSGLGTTTTVSSRAICASTEFKCASGYRDCVPGRYVCDGDRDCSDGSDEASCGFGSSLYRTTPGSIFPSCKTNEISCSLWNTSSGCVPLAKICDGQTDCRYGTDEGFGCQLACRVNNGNCSDTCHATPTGLPICSCRPGFQLAANGKNCIDIDECQPNNVTTTYPCSQTCKNTNSSFTCGCITGYSLNADGVSCSADDRFPAPLLVFGSDSRIHWSSPDGIHHNIIAPGRHSSLTVGIDFLEENNTTMLFYSDSKRNEILLVDLEAKTEQVVLGGLRCPEGLALDWVARNLYYVDSENEVLGVCALREQTTYCAKLISDRLESPRAVVVHPGQRAIFFTQWGWEAKIERAWLDGSNRLEIVTTKLAWPNALAIDFIHNRLYWIDTKLDRIESVKFDGLERRTSLHLPNAHTYGLAILGDRLYWSEWGSSSIRTAPLNGSSNSTVHETERRPMGIVVLHSSRQPSSPSPCDKKVPNPCHHICLARPSDDLHTCLCHSGFRLASGMCVPIGVTQGGVSHAPPRVLNAPPIRTAGISCKTSLDCNCSPMEAESTENVCVCLQNRCVTSSPFKLDSFSTLGDPSAAIWTGVAVGSILCVLCSILVVVIIVRRHRQYEPSSPCPTATSLIDDDFEPKQHGRASAAGEFFSKFSPNKKTPSTTTPTSFAVNFNEDMPNDNGNRTMSTNGDQQHHQSAL